MVTTIRWNKEALRQFEKAIAYIEEHSSANADKFKVDILERTDTLLKHP